MSGPLWGPCSRTFDPNRWLSDHAPSDPSGPGIWPNVMTFIDGPRRCVGYKLALMELKMLLFVLIQSFVFEPLPAARIGKWNLFSTRPYLAGELYTVGSSMPLVVRPYKD
jgi:cytochrome P450